MDEARARLEQLIGERGCNYSALSRLIGRNPAYIQQYIRRGSPRRLEDRDCETLATFFGVQPTELGATPPDPTSAQIDLVPIPVLDVAASAGHGAIVDAEAQTTQFGFPKQWLRRLTPSRSSNLSIICVRGDSMEPTLHDGDDVLVDSADGLGRLRDGIYVLRMDGALNVKRIAIEPQGGKISVISDNDAYPTWSGLHRRAVNIVGRVLWFGRPL